MQYEGQSVLCKIALYFLAYGHFSGLHYAVKTIQPFKSLSSSSYSKIHNERHASSRDVQIV